MSYARVDDILPLAPLQEGLLFHALINERGADVYTTQTVLRLSGPLDAPNLQRAAEALWRRYPNLHASFKYQGLSHPVQVISRDLPLIWQEVDLSGVEPIEQRRLLSACLDE